MADWFEAERGRYTFKAVSAFLVQQLLGLLGTKGMTMGQVIWERAGGIRTIRNFMNMLAEAAHVAGVKVKAKAYTGESGTFWDGQNYWVGINYDDPNHLLFQTWNRRVDPVSASALDVGKVNEWNNKKGHGWGREMDLTADNAHFYAGPRASPTQVLEALIRDSMERAHRVKLPNNSATEPDDRDSDGE